MKDESRLEPPEQIQANPDTVSPALPAPLGSGPSAWSERDAAPSVRLERPFPLHPTFWWALLWCLGLVLFTQLPAALVAVLVLVIVAVSDPEQIKSTNSPAVQGAVAVAVLLAHGLIIAFALLLLRIVAGRDWTRQVALRLPSGGHLLLTLAAVPAFVVLGTVAYQVIKRGLGFPGMDDAAGVAAFWGGLVLALLVAGAGELMLRTGRGAAWYRRDIEPMAWPYRMGLSVGVLGALGSVVWLGYVGLKPELAPLLGSGGLTGMEEMAEMFASWPVAAAVLVVGVFPALSEELWCRAYLGRGLVGAHGPFWGVLLTSLLFGLIHFDPCQGTMAVLMGLVLHALYLATRSLLVPVLMHFLNNSLAVLLARLPGAAALERQSVTPDSDGLSVAALMLTGALLLGATLGALYRCRARLVGPAEGLTWQPPYPGVALPPPGSGTRVWAPRPSPLAVLSVVVALMLFALALVIFVERFSGRAR